MGKTYQQTLHQKYTDGNKAHEKMFNISSQWELQIKIIIRYYFTVTRMAIIKKDSNKCQQGCGEIGIFIHLY